MKKFLAIASFALLSTGCATQQSLYHWGSYEQLSRDMYVKPGEATPEIQIEKLNADIQQAQAEGKKVAPGVYTHLGMMYAAAGQPERSLEALMQEKTLFPESTTFVDTLISNQQQVAK